VAQGDEFATSRKYCDKKWQEMLAANAVGGQDRGEFRRRCVCDRRWQEKVEAKIGDERTRERDRRRCLGVYVDNDYPEYLLVGGAAVVIGSFLLPQSKPVSP
jgi:hypothetical protein